MGPLLVVAFRYALEKRQNSMVYGRYNDLYLVGGIPTPLKNSKVYPSMVYGLWYTYPSISGYLWIFLGFTHQQTYLRGHHPVWIVKASPVLYYDISIGKLQ